MKKRASASMTLEYAILLAIVISVLVVMFNYMKFILEGRWRSVGDQFGYGRQYEPGVTESYSFSDADITNWSKTHPNWSAPW
ncbi:MAG: hypothetical protein NC923_04490 [Candidatus Omnitrophica bacterium]|nr:hypothetical protein [Candidatus Omnitrophota bacterium]